MALSLDATVCGPEANTYADLDTATVYFEADATLGPVWSELAEVERQRLLASAARIIDLVDWAGRPLNAVAFSGYGLEQARAFPRTGHTYRTGQAASGSTTTLADPGLADQPQWPDSFFNEGSALSLSGSNRGLIRSVSAFDSAAGTLTVVAFPNAVAAGDGYALIWPLADKIVQACLEQAGHLYQAGAEGLNDLASRGVSSASVDGLSLSFDGRPVPELCHRARALLVGYRASGPLLERS